MTLKNDCCSSTLCCEGDLVVALTEGASSEDDYKTNNDKSPLKI